MCYLLKMIRDMVKFDKRDQLLVTHHEHVHPS